MKNTKMVELNDLLEMVGLDRFSNRRGGAYGGFSENQEEEGPMVPRTPFFNRFEKIVWATAAATAIGYGAFTDYVKPWEFAVKQVNISPLGVFGEKGIQKEKVEFGIHPVIPGFQSYIILPKDLQVLNLHKGGQNLKSGIENVRYTGAARIQTADGFWTDLDVSVLFRNEDPYKVIDSAGAGELFWSNGIIPKAESDLKVKLGELEPEDFYKADKRVAKQTESRDKLDITMQNMGMAVDHVLIRRVEYHKDIQERIEGRVLKEQMVHTNDSIAKKNEAQSRLDKITKEGEKAAEVEKERGDSYYIDKESQWQKYEREKAAEGDKAVNLANAYRTDEVNKAFEGAGSDLLVAREMAKSLSGVEEFLVPVGDGSSTHPLNLEYHLKNFGIGGREQ